MEIEATSNGGAGDAVDPEKGSTTVRTMHLTWEYLTVVIPNFGEGPTRRLLSGLSGFAEPGRTMAIMGPSGSGKSTLLDSLAGRLSGNLVMTGNVLLNGKKRMEKSMFGYVTQQTVLLGTLTVRETITFSARMRLPSTMSKEEVEDVVEATISDMGLQECAHNQVGNWHLRGISGGEKKRLSIALEILTRPTLLFLDEPTTGLDSASAFFVAQALRNIARDGKTVLSSIHQPSSEVFALFDDLFLLSGGETIYFGEAKIAVEFFAEAGFPCPSRRNPSEHFLRCINSDFDAVTKTLVGSRRINLIESTSHTTINLSTAEIRGILIRKYQCSKYAAKAKAKIKEISTLEEPAVFTKSQGQAKWWKQLCILTHRSFLNMSRDLGYYWMRIAVYVVLSICLGSVFFNVGTSYNSIVARAACGGFLSGFMTMMSIGGFPSFIEELKVFYHERLGRHYGVAVYILSNSISSFPYLVAMSVSSAAITYFMVKFRPGFNHFSYAFLDLICSIAAVEGCMMIIASLVPNFLMGVVVGAGYIGILMMTSGFFRFLPDLPKPFWRYPFSFINHGAWGLQGAYKNDLIGLEFDSPAPDGPKLEGDFILKNILKVDVGHSKWWDLAAVAIILTSYRVIFFLVLKFRERATPLFRMLYTKRTLKHLKKRASFRKMSPFPSKRHQPQHSLSSQEGLQSPIHY